MSNQLYEFVSFDKGNIVVESSSDGKELFMSGIFIQGDVKNHNQRVYPANQIESAVQQIKKRIQEGHSVLGELDHPEHLSINLDRVSHMITDMWMDGRNGIGKLKILPTPCGTIAKTLLQAGAKLGVSSRGSGNVGYDGTVSEFDIVTVDIVAQPSAPNAYPKTIYESLFNMRGGEVIFKTAQACMYDTNAEEYLKKDIMKLIRELKKGE